MSPLVISPCFGLQQSGDGLERGGLAAAVRPDQGHDLAVAHFQRDAVQDPYDAQIGHFDVVDFQHRYAWAPSPR